MGTAPALKVTVCVVVGDPVQPELANRLYATVPPVAKPGFWFVMLVVSCADAPVCSEPLQLALVASSITVVDTDGVALMTVKASQVPIEAESVPFPLNSAWYE